VGGRDAQDLRVDLSDRGAFSFLLMGDTGEGDYSQYALVPPLCTVAEACEAAFVVICSDVIYPVGNVNDYGDKFYGPYRTLMRPIYTIPGNHDWYDNLTAFMANFGSPKELPASSAEDPDRAQDRLAGLWYDARSWVRDALWRAPPTPLDPAAIADAARLRGDPRQQQPQPQPGSYYVIDTAHLRLVCIDTGIRGDLDEQQGRWLVEVSRDPRAKILLTGKPLLVDGKVHPCPIDGEPGGYASVLRVVHDSRFGYVAVIGGDIHNYQHYPAAVPDVSGTRTVHHIVSGGGGAFMHATHTVPVLTPRKKTKLFDVTEKEYKAYPLRRDSLAAYSRVVQGILDRLPLRWWTPRVELTEKQAAEVLHQLLGTPRERPAQQASEPPVDVTRGQLWWARVLLRVGGRHFHSLLSPFCDWDDAPFFKHFLRVDVRADGATIWCHAVTGCGESEADPPVEDTIELRWPRTSTSGR
jgi:hypothetical protein